MNNALKSKEDLSKNETQLETKVASLEKELITVRKAAERAQGMDTAYSDDIFPVLTSYKEEQRKASQHNIALSEESLEEYRKLYV